MTLEEKFGQIVVQHKGSIYTVCYMFSKSKQEIDDLYQEVLINLWCGFKEFRGDCKISTWIYRVSLNTCLQLKRHRKRLPQTVPLSVNINLFEDQDEQTKQIQKLYQRINQLEHFDRALILLWLENLSYEEIGDVLGITVSNVSVRLVRIKEQLKKM